MKKYILPLLIITMVIQLCLPAYYVFEKYDTLKHGNAYKFSIELYDPYDAYRGRYVALSINDHRSVDSHYNGSYGHIALDNNGFAYTDSIAKAKPSSGDYVKSSNRNYFVIPADRYYTDEDLAPQMQELLTGSNIEKLHPYIILRVKNGNSVIQGLYIDGIRIEDYLIKMA